MELRGEESKLLSKPRVIGKKRSRTDLSNNKNNKKRAKIIDRRGFGCDLTNIDQSSSQQITQSPAKKRYRYIYVNILYYLFIVY